MNCLSAEKISKSYKGRRVVRKVEFEVKPGEVVGLLGPNGAGKTTSFYIVVGLTSTESGRVSLDGVDITKMPMHRRARNGISYLPQNKSIFSKMTVKNNLYTFMEIAKVPRNERDNLCQKLLKRFDIEHIAESMGAALSGGERRRVEIARSLVMSPKYLLLDEPFAGIDPVTVQEIQKLIEELKNDGLGVLITDHNVRETLTICDRAYVLAKGEIVEKGSPQQILDSELVKKIYLGEGFSI